MLRSLITNGIYRRVEGVGGCAWCSWCWGEWWGGPQLWSPSPWWLRPIPLGSQPCAGIGSYAGMTLPPAPPHAHMNQWLYLTISFNIPFKVVITHSAFSFFTCEYTKSVFWPIIFNCFRANNFISIQLLDIPHTGLSSYPKRTVCSFKQVLNRNLITIWF